MATSEEKEKIRKQNLFKGTISVSVVYAFVALLLLVFIYYTEAGKQLVEGSNFPFVISFTIGMLAVISFLIYKVVTFKPVVIRKLPYDDLACPDYWKLTKTPDTIVSTFSTDLQPSAKYKCVKSGGAVSPTNVTVSKTDTNTKLQKLATVGEMMRYTVNADNVTLSCDNLYPKIISNSDITNYPDSQNTIRCAYAYKCGLNWSSVCPQPSI